MNSPGWHWDSLWRPLRDLAVLACSIGWLAVGGCAASAPTPSYRCTEPAEPPTEPAQDPYDVAADLRARCQFQPGSLTRETVGPGAPDFSAIAHVIVVLHENHSFDHYLGAYQREGGLGTETLDVAPDGVFNLDTFATPPAPVMRYSLRKEPNPYCVEDTPHNWSDVHLQFDNGRLDGFVTTSNTPLTSGSRYRAMGYYDRTDLPFYYWLVDNFAISDRYFSSLLGPTHPNLMFQYHATSCGFTEGLQENYQAVLDCGTKVPSIFSRLKDKNVSYKVYSSNSWPLGEAAAAVMFGGYDRVVGTLGDFAEDVDKDQLPAVVFVEPTYDEILGQQNDEHPDKNVRLGQRFSFEVIDKVMSNPTVWNKTVMFLTWDEHGGYYDHVVPPKACSPSDFPPDTLDFQFDRYGLRVPLIVVSPFTRKGHVSHRVTDHTSILRFIEHWQGLGALTRRDANAWPMLDLLDMGSQRAVGRPDPALAPVVNPGDCQ